MTTPASTPHSNARSPASLRAAFDDAARDLADVDVDVALEARVIAAATAPPSVAPRIAGVAGVAAVVLVVAYAFAGGRTGAVHVDAAPGAVVTIDGHRATVARGLAHFRVDKIDAGEAPVVVAAGSRTITVMGTRFDVDVTDHGGRVALFEGAIRLGAPDGSFEDLVPGDARRWENQATVAAPTLTPTLTPTSLPNPTATPTPSTAIAATATATASRASTKAKATASATAATSATSAQNTASNAGTAAIDADANDADANDVDDADAQVAAVLRTTNALRQAGRFDDAVAAIDRGLRNVAHPRAQETLSVERALVLERAGREVDACAAWREAAARFPGGHAARQVRAAVARCDDEVP